MLQRLPLFLPLLLLTSCASGPPQPRERLGCLPFPGPFTLYAVADPKDLGSHRYESWWDHLGQPDETSRGILYTCRAGFLDLAHMRESMDFTKYIHDRVHERLTDTQAFPDGGSFHFTWTETRYDIRVQRPDWWSTLSADDRATIAKDAAIRAGQRFAVLVGAWHEAGTWVGQESVPPISEQGSAFTWEDCTSHVVASIIASRAIHDMDADPSLTWNAAATRELPAVLAELEVVDTDCEDQAVHRVENIWWKDGLAIRRDLSTGLDNGVKTPWLVRGLECCGGAQAETSRNDVGLPVPTLADVQGHDLRPFIEVRITPPQWMLRKLLGELPPEKAITRESQVFQVLDRVHTDILRVFGPDGDHP